MKTSPLNRKAAARNFVNGVMKRVTMTGSATVSLRSGGLVTPDVIVSEAERYRFATMVNGNTVTIARRKSVVSAV